MLKKLKEKIIPKFLLAKINPVFTAIFTGSLLFFGIFFLLPNKAMAACSPPTLLSPSTYKCDASTISLTVPSVPVRVGEQVTFRVTLNNNSGVNILNDIFTTQKDVSIQLGANVVQIKKLAANAGGAVTFEASTVGPPNFPKAGNYAIHASVDLGCAGTALDTPTNCRTLVGPDVTFQVLDADTTGPAKLTLDPGQKSVLPESTTVSTNFNFNFLPGASGRTVSKFLYYCDYKNNESVGFKEASASANRFNCLYQQNQNPQTPVNYSVFVKAVLDNGEQLNSNRQTVQITGREAAEGATTIGPNSSNIGTGLLEIINRIIGFILGLISEFIYLVFYWLVAPLIQAMLSIHTYTDQFAAVIYPGWEVVRNLCNIIFIVAIIAIGLGTLFRVDAYQYKELLVQLIIAALLINFSLVIGQAVLGLADTVQSQFLPNNVEVIRALARDLMVSYRDVLYKTDFGSQGNFAGTIQPLFLLALSLGSFGVFCAIAAFLVIRIVALWILLMLSPIAYAAGVLPTTSHYRSEWWGMFIKYAFFTPIMAFFLNLTAVIANMQKENPILQKISSQDFGLSNGTEIAPFVFKVASNILLLVFLMAALKVAEQFGIFGASAVTELAKGGMLAPFKGVGWLGQKGLGYAGYKWNAYTAHLAHGRKVDLKTRAKFALLNPVAAIKGWQKHGEELRHAAQGEAEAVGLMVAEQTLSPGKAFNRKALAERAHDAEFLKNYSELTREEAFDTAYDVATMKDDMNGRAAKRAIIEANMKEGWIDDIIMEADENGRGKELIAKMRALKSQYKITDGDFEDVEEVEYETETDPTTGKKSYKRDPNTGKKIAVQVLDPATGRMVDKKVIDPSTGRPKVVRRLKYDAKTRRSMYLAMFGEDMRTETDENGVERTIVSFKDQTAGKMIADISEVNGKSTKHAEYMSDEIYDAQANHGTGGYAFYDLEFAKEVVDDLGTHQVGADGRALSGRYIGQLITKNHAGAVHSRKEVAKWGSREQAGVAPHALMDMASGKLDKEMFQVISKAMSENPGFAQERTANLLLTGTDDPAKLRQVIETYKRTGVLEVDEKAYTRIQDMMSVSPDGLAAIIARFINKGDKDGARAVREGKVHQPSGAAALTANQLRVKFTDQAGASQNLPLTFR